MNYIKPPKAIVASKRKERASQASLFFLIADIISILVWTSVIMLCVSAAADFISQLINS